MKKYKSKRPNNLWISKGLKKSSKTKEILYRKFVKNPSHKNERDYKIYRNKLNHLRSNISNTRKSVSSDIQALRSGLKTRGGAESF